MDDPRGWFSARNRITGHLVAEDQGSEADHRHLRGRQFDGRVSVTDGALVDLILEATDSTEVMDDGVVVRARAADVYGNLRPVVVTWTLVEDPLNANQWMDSTSGNPVVLDLTEADVDRACCAS